MIDTVHTFTGSQVSPCETTSGGRTSGGSSEFSPAHFLLKEPAKVLRASDQDAPCLPPFKVFQVRPTGRRPRGSLQNTLEGLNIPSDPGIPSEAPRRRRRK